MNEINYTYEVISVNEQSRCMEIVYSSEGRETQHIGARLPYEGETLESVISMYAPVAYWLEKEKSVVAPAVGHTGSLTVQVAPTSGESENITTISVDVVAGV